MERLLTEIDSARQNEALALAVVTSVTRDEAYAVAPGTPLHHHMVLEPKTPAGLARFAELLASPDVFAPVIRTAHGYIGAYALAQRLRDEAGELTGVVELVHLMVMPEFQRQGVGGRLLREVESRAGPDATIRAWVFDCERSAVPFYKREGYLASDETWDEDLGAMFIAMQKGEQGSL
ncbi:MAG TPA: GNAT family N-acetyltransferase [Candidatus Saccharimonadales bacterium]|nr:GNAT family N-acetyltransferase [Candidatus Saccharimonadales bacterium]